jgi:DinB superfamily
MVELANTLQALRSFPSTLRTFLAEAPADSTDWRPDSWDGIPSESLTIRQQVCHVRDIEIDGYAVRFARLLREQNPLLESIDTYALVESRRYDQTEIASALDAFELARAGTLRQLEGLDASQLSRRGAFEGYGPVTLKALVHYLCSHDQQHLAGVQWLIGRQSAI